jgi:hypothetical protein
MTYQFRLMIHSSYFLTYVVRENTVIAKKLIPKFLDLHVFNAHEYEKAILEYPFGYIQHIYIYTRASSTPERLSGFYLYSLFESLFIIYRPAPREYDGYSTKK